ncbi:MAG: diguanylate cyclase, partial [Thiotrichaceae bacterium]|nr:diguanylate cyclase [Thiotrichaceae bacterium]
MTDPVDLVQGGKGFLVYFPIFVQGEFDGFILAVFRVQEWLNYVFSIKGSPEGLENFKVSVFIDDSFVFKQTSWDSSSSTFVEAVKHVELMGHRFTVYCRPTAAFFRHHDTLVYKVIAGVSLLLAVLISFVVHLFQKATTETWRTHLAKKTLEITIQELKKTKNELYDASSHLDFATKAGNIGIWAWNITNNTMSWNTIMYELYDVPPDIHPTYETWYKALHPEDCLKTEALLQNSVQGKTVFNTEFRIILTDGVVRSIKTAARIERDSAGEPIRMTGVNLDITEQKKAEEKIYHLANHDALTGLPSLRLAKERALMAINTAHRNKTSTAVLFIDLDGFKHVNDNYGHDAGDALLNEVAKRLLLCVRETDTVARIGGDEFLIILTEFISSNDVGLITEKLVKIVSQAFIFRKNHIAVGASIGIALYPVNGKDIEKLIKQADEAMYKIKKSGKNGYAFVTPEK